VIAVDTSALIAILWDENDAPRVRSRLTREGGGLISAGNALELQLVLSGAGAQNGWDEVEGLFSAFDVVVHPFDQTQLAIARAASVRFGKGRHKAKLNFGDCFAYALAMSEGIPLLFTGKDFSATDVAVA
jgi:ribonuclease VapC